MEMFKYLTAPFVRLYHERRKRHFRLSADYGISIEVIEFKSTLENARGKTVKTFSWHEADRADLEELVDGEWQHVATSPNPSITMDNCEQV